MKFSVIGGGPGGLCFAYLMKRSNPMFDITVYEQNRADATYGWGIVFSDIALSFLRDVDPKFHQAFVAHHERCDYMEIVHNGAHVQVHNNHFSRTSRIGQLRMLQDICAAAGVVIRYEMRIDDPAALDADVVVAADGVNSATRTRHADSFRPSFEKRRNKFAWYGTHQLFHPVSLLFRETPHGVFIAHCYQYSPELSTFLVEVDPETWRRAGLDHAGDEESREICAAVFRPELGASALLSNRSLWFGATVVRNENWTHDNIVLIGDACRTVHFSLGSGTRMALQDAIALWQAFREHGRDVPAAFRAYEAARRPGAATFQEAADRSLSWYENVAEKMPLEPVTFAYDYMRRTGRVTHEALRERDPRFIAAYEARARRPA